METRGNVFAAILAGLVIFGCAKDPSLIGTWTSESTSRQGVHAKTEDVYYPDGRFVGFTHLSGPTGGTIISIDTGTWKLLGKDKLTIVLKNVEWEVVGLTAAGQSRVRKRLAENKRKIIEDVNKQFPVTIKWNGPDEFSSTTNGETDIYRRKK